MEKAYKFRLYPNPKQIMQIQKTFGCVRFVYNHFLASRIEQYKTTGKSNNWISQSKILTILKKELNWLQEVDSTALQSSVKDLDFAYQNFFRRVKQGKKPGFPKFKRKHDNHKSYKSRRVGGNIKLLNNAIQLPKLGLVKCRVSRQPEGRILSATVSQAPSGKYFVSVCCTDIEIKPYEAKGKMIGLDLGLKDFAITSDGQIFENHRYLYKAQKKLAKLQRKLSRKAKGSNNRNKARIKVACQHERIANQRNDMLHKLSTQLIKNYDLIALETLRSSNMIKNRRLAKSISDVAWSEFVRQLEYKAVWRKVVIVKIDTFYPSSQTCSVCGQVNPKTKDLSIRNWVCPECGAEHDRDINAAKNILQEGLRLIA